MPDPIGSAAAGVGLLQKAARFVRRPMVSLACRLAGIDTARELFALENAKLSRDHALEECKKLDAAVDEVEYLGPLLSLGMYATEDKARYDAKHRLRALHPDLPAICDGTALPIGPVPEWQRVAQIARPAISNRRAIALSSQPKRA